MGQNGACRLLGGPARTSRTTDRACRRLHKATATDDHARHRHTWSWRAACMAPGGGTDGREQGGGRLGSGASAANTVAGPAAPHGGLGARGLAQCWVTRGWAPRRQSGAARAALHRPHAAWGPRGAPPGCGRVRALSPGAAALACVTPAGRGSVPITAPELRPPPCQQSRATSQGGVAHLPISEGPGPARRVAGGERAGATGSGVPFPSHDEWRWQGRGGQGLGVTVGS